MQTVVRQMWFAMKVIVRCTAFLLFLLAFPFQGVALPPLRLVPQDQPSLNDLTGDGDVSADGEWVVISSLASNLTPEDTNRFSDVYLFNTRTKQFTLLSKGIDGSSSNGGSFEPRISSNGSVVVFTSASSNLVANDTNNATDVFLYDIASGVLSRISVSQEGKEANDFSEHARVSTDGRFVAFSSYARNLLPDDTNEVRDVFRKDRNTGELLRVSLGKGGIEGTEGRSYTPEISGDGKTIVFTSIAKGLDPAAVEKNYSLYLWKESLGYAQIIYAQEGTDVLNPALALSGSAVVYEANKEKSAQPLFSFLPSVEPTTEVRLIEFDENGKKGSSKALTTDLYNTYVSYNPSITSDGAQVTFLVHPKGSFEKQSVVTVAWREQKNGVLTVEDQMGSATFDKVKTKFFGRALLFTANSIAEGEKNDFITAYFARCAADYCPNDTAKVDPGQCGCGASEVDSDNDKTPDCKDLCKNDSLKTAPGVCGCGVADTDSDGDGLVDCKDECPTDKLKRLKGVCGCGISDRDSDYDYTPDCSDACPIDRFKIEPGQCGCGIPDADLNNNNVVDCLEPTPTPTPLPSFTSTIRPSPTAPPAPTSTAVPTATVLPRATMTSTVVPTSTMSPTATLAPVTTAAVTSVAPTATTVPTVSTERSWNQVVPARPIVRYKAARKRIHVQLPFTGGKQYRIIMRMGKKKKIIWSVRSSSFARSSKLSPGSYAVSYKVLSSDNVWSGESPSATLKIR